MRCTEYEVMISGYLDGELDEEHLEELKKHLAECPACRKELERARMLKQSLDMLAIRTPEDEFWDGYWAGIYNRLERNTGWIFLSIGMLMLVAGGLTLLLRELLFSAETPLWVAIGGVFVIIGLTVLFVSLFRERTRINRHERYKDVRR